MSSTFIAKFAEINYVDIILAFAVSLLMGLFIYAIYRMTFAGVMYSRSFGVSLIAMTLITNVAILAVTQSVILSLGMVGALSIVRYRTAIKDPIDLMFLFWSISVGIICGAGLAQVAVILSVIITLGILVLDAMPVAKAPMILVVNADDLDAEDAVVKAVKKHVKHVNVKSRNMTDVSLDLVMELRTSEGSALVRDVKKVSGVTAVSLLSHDGEVTF